MGSVNKTLKMNSLFLDWTRLFQQSVESVAGSPQEQALAVEIASTVAAE